VTAQAFVPLDALVSLWLKPAAIAHNIPFSITTSPQVLMKKVFFY
jgi:hypothetical protein